MMAIKQVVGPNLVKSDRKSSQQLVKSVSLSSMCGGSNQCYFYSSNSIGLPLPRDERDTD